MNIPLLFSDVYIVLSLGLSNVYKVTSVSSTLFAANDKFV